MYPQLSQFAKFSIISTPFEYLNHFFAYQFSRKLIFSIFLHLEPWFLLLSVRSTFFSAILHKSNTNIASRSFKNLVSLQQFAHIFSSSDRTKFATSQQHTSLCRSFTSLDVFSVLFIYYKKSTYCTEH